MEGWSIRAGLKLEARPNPLVCEWEYQGERLYPRLPVVPLPEISLIGGGCLPSSDLGKSHENYAN